MDFKHDLPIIIFYKFTILIILYEITLKKPLIIIIELFMFMHKNIILFCIKDFRHNLFFFLFLLKFLDNYIVLFFIIFHIMF